MYQETAVRVKSSLSNAKTVALTTDGWTSRAHMSYITVTSAHITPEWKLENFVLQTRSMPESHTGLNIANVVRDAISEWCITTPNPPLVSDNAANMTVAARELGSQPHIGCFAHTLNLGAQKALKITSVSRILGRVRKLVGYFHRSTTAAAVLSAKTNLLGVKNLKLTCDVPTRWNSAADMLERYLKLQPAVYATLLSPEISRHIDHETSMLNEADTKLAEDIVKCLYPLKAITEAVCTESMPTVSAIIPLIQKVQQNMALIGTDSPMSRSIKEAVLSDLNTRYTSEELQNFLSECTLLDPRFKTTYLTPEAMENTYHRLALLLQSGDGKVHVQADTQAPTPGQHIPPHPVLPERPNTSQSPSPTETSDEENAAKCQRSSDSSKKVGLAAIFDFENVEEATAAKPMSLQEKIEEEIKQYKLMNQISIESNALDWWKKNCIQFPLLASVAKQRLCIPATSVPAERVFSSAGDIVTAQRASLAPELVDMLLFCKKNCDL
ncbi:E3 SUMO-protein ligase ZBED1-like [Dreissena polymorpha]|uniref:E3 SUMO-protein ligase ZBED1-like n=1 Tax=Dreissena polymorpha TaxID=45954 RepID=UPI0022645754|nr:E3 SUMO-protein ligase ZBED1-like [Dreissena polymorpha]